MMKNTGKCLLIMLGCFLSSVFNGAGPGEDASPAAADPPPFGPPHALGRLGDDRLVECSGMEVSRVTEGIFWAVNDGGHGPFLYALAKDGRSLGRVKVRGAENRDWEGLEIFRWQGRWMILIADFGDNRERHDTHTLYVVPEPRPVRGRFPEGAVAGVAWRIVFRYPDGPHDGEGIAVDAAGNQVLLLTKRDVPPLVFSLPLAPPGVSGPVTARKVASVERIPPPSDEDLLKKYGPFVSQPTALDISADGRRAVVLTYKHAYLFQRDAGGSWSTAFGRDPILIPLPMPWDRKDLRQREAICFSVDDRALLVTSEGLGAGIFRLEAR